jgi:hypothetical protein
MLRFASTRQSAVVTVFAALFALALVGCSKPAFRNMLAPGDDTHVEIDAVDGVDTWSVVTKSDVDVIVVRLIGLGADVGAMRARVLLPGGVVVAVLSPPPGGQFSIALSGRQATWTLEFGLAEGQSPPVRYRMVIERPSAVGSAATRCADVLRARGVNAWVSAISGPPAPSGILFPGLGAMAVSAVPAGKLTAASPAPGAPTVLHIGGGTTLRGDLAGLGCDPGQVQLNFWDTGKGKPPTLTLADPSGRALCGISGQPTCPSNPPAAQWMTWTFWTAGTIRSLSLECDELYLSSIVIQ